MSNDYKGFISGLPAHGPLFYINADYASKWLRKKMKFAFLIFVAFAQSQVTDKIGFNGVVTRF